MSRRLLSCLVALSLTVPIASAEARPPGVWEKIVACRGEDFVVDVLDESVPVARRRVVLADPELVDFVVRSGAIEDPSQVLTAEGAIALEVFVEQRLTAEQPSLDERVSISSNRFGDVTLAPGYMLGLIVNPTSLEIYVSSNTPAGGRSERRQRTFQNVTRPGTSIDETEWRDLFVADGGVARLQGRVVRRELEQRYQAVFRNRDAISQLVDARVLDWSDFDGREVILPLSRSEGRLYQQSASRGDLRWFDVRDTEVNVTRERLRECDARTGHCYYDWAGSTLLTDCRRFDHR